MNKIKSFLLILVAAALIVFAVGCSFSVSTAKIEDALMTTSIDANGMPGEQVVSYSSNAPVLYASAKLLNAPDNTSIRIVWTYLTGDQLMDEITLDSGDISDRYIYSSYEPSSALPEGNYQVEFFVEDRDEPDASLMFIVIANEPLVSTDGAYLEDTHMTSNIDASGVPVDTISTVASTGTWYVSSILRNTQPDTILSYVWYDTNGDIIDSYSLDPQGATDVYVFGSFELAGVAPDGQYRIEIYINDAALPDAAVDFIVD